MNKILPLQPASMVPLWWTVHMRKCRTKPHRNDGTCAAKVDMACRHHAPSLL